MSQPFLLGNPYYLLLSLVIMCYASFTMLNMIEQPETGGRSYGLNWMIGGASVFSLGLWTMHVISLLASDHRIVMNGLMLVILVGCGMIIYTSFLVDRQLMRGGHALGGMLLAAGATMLHYMSMLSDSVSMLNMNWWLFLLSYAANFCGAWTAYCMLGRKSRYYKIKSSLVLGFANMLMHQIGMRALSIEYSDIMTTDRLNNYLLLFAFLLGVSTMIILSFSLTTWLASNKYGQIHERYKLLVENSLDTIALIADDKWEYINEAGIRMFEASGESELMGTSIYWLLDERHHAELGKWLADEQAEQERPERPIELLWHSVKGTPLHTEMIRASTTLSGRKIKQVIIRDISERKKNEELLVNSEKLYIAGQLAAGIAHEIRNPLTSLKGFLQLMSTGRGSGDHYYPIMKSELIHIEAIVSELLMLSKPQAYELKRSDASLLMQEAISLLEGQASFQHARIQLRSVVAPLWVLGVEAQLKQVFINILKNAIEAMPGGGVVRVAMELDDSACYVMTHISDEGSGMPKEQLATLGQPFYTTKDRGTGLGLMVTYKIVDNHQGEIFAESQIGVGTTFTIKLPYAPPDI
jgi:two-component system sporulation sensor kinase A